MYLNVYEDIDKLIILYLFRSFNIYHDNLALIHVITKIPIDN